MLLKPSDSVTQWIIVVVILVKTSRKFEEKPRIRNANPYICFLLNKRRRKLISPKAVVIRCCYFLSLVAHPPFSVSIKCAHTHILKNGQKKKTLQTSNKHSLKRQMSQCQNELHIFFTGSDSDCSSFHFDFFYVCECFSIAFSFVILFRLFMSTADIST